MRGRKRERNMEKDGDMRDKKNEVQKDMTERRGRDERKLECLTVKRKRR